MLNTSSQFTVAQTGEPINETGAGMPKATRPAQIHTIFNRASRGLLRHLLDPTNNIPDVSWRTLSGFPTAGSVTDKTAFIEAYIKGVFAAEWPEPAKPAELAAGADDRTRIAHEREMAAYKKAQRLYNTQYQPSLTYFTEQVLKAWPGYKETVSDSDFKEGLPKPILPEDYPRYAQSLFWYLTEARGENKQRLAQTAHDLRTTSLKEIQSEWIKTFPSSVTSQHLQSCDDLFLDEPIPDDTPKDSRHPDPAVKTHAEIIATGLTADDKGWTLRRINSQKAAMYYGNTERTADGTPKQNASPLCFTWSGERKINFSTYATDLLMIARDDGSVVRFLCVNESMYNDMRDNSIDLKQIFQEFPALDQTIGTLILRALQTSIDRKDVHAFYMLLQSIEDVQEWKDAATPLAVELIPTALQISISAENKSKRYGADFRGILYAVKHVPEWKGAAWEGFGRKARPESQEIMIDILGPMPDFDDRIPTAITIHSLTHS